MILRAILDTILLKHHITADQVSITSVLKTFKEKVKYILRRLQELKSSRKKARLLEKWKKTAYELK